MTTIYLVLQTNRGIDGLAPPSTTVVKGFRSEEKATLAAAKLNKKEWAYGGTAKVQPIEIED